MYAKYPESKLYRRLKHLNNRDLAILFGVFIGISVAIDGIFFGNFLTAPILGSVIGRSLPFKIGAIILTGGTFGNLLSYVGSCIDIITNHKTIFHILWPKK